MLQGGAQIKSQKQKCVNRGNFFTPNLLLKCEDEKCIPTFGSRRSHTYFCVVSSVPNLYCFFPENWCTYQSYFYQKVGKIFLKKISVYFFQFLGLGTLVAVSIFLRPTHTNNSSNFKSQMFLEVFCVEVVAPFTLLFEVR